MTKVDRATSRHRLGKELRRLREHTGRTLEEVAERLECSVAKVSRIETGQVAVRPIDLREMLDCYGIAGARRTAMLSVARQLHQRDWWRTYADIIYDGYDHYVGYEEEASEIHEYQPQWIPGLLQTHDYARAMAEAYGSSPEDAGRLADLRHARQAILLRDDPPHLSVIIDEPALRRPGPVPGLMRDQLRHLIAAGPRVTVQVLPLSAGMHPGQCGGFIVLGFADPAEGNVVYTDNLTEGQLIHDPEHVARYAWTFGRLRELAMSHQQSARLIEELIDEHP